MIIDNSQKCIHVDKPKSTVFCYLQGNHGTGKTGKMAKKNPCQEKHREFGNSAKTLGILFAQVINSLILKVKESVIFVAEFSIFFPEAG